MPNAKLGFLALRSIWYVPSATCHSGSAEKIKILSPLVLLLGEKKRQNDSKHPGIRLKATTTKRRMIEPFAQYSSSRSRLKSFVSLQTLTDECCRVLSIATTVQSGKHWKLISAMTFLALLKTTKEERDPAVLAVVWESWISSCTATRVVPFS